MRDCFSDLASLSIFPDVFQNPIRAIAQNAYDMVRATLKGTLAAKLKLEDVTALGPDILTAVKVRGPGGHDVWK